MTDETRQPIPAELQRRVLVESGHRCAVCRHMQTEIHHIIPWATCREHAYENLVALCPNCHTQAHKGGIDRKALRLYKFNLRTAHDRFSQLEVDVLFELFRAPPNAIMPWSPLTYLLIKRIVEAGYVQAAHSQNTAAYEGPFRVDALRVQITEKGRTYITDMGLHEASDGA